MGVCEGGLNAQVLIDLPPLPQCAAVRLNLTLANYSPTLLQKVHPAVLVALSRATKGIACSVNLEPRGDSTKPLIAEAVFGICGRSAAGVAASLAASLRRNLKGWPGLKPFSVRVPGLVRVDVIHPKPTWVPNVGRRRVINATLYMEIGGMDAKGSASGWNNLVARIRNVSTGAGDRAARVPL